MAAQNDPTINMNHAAQLKKRVSLVTWLFIVGLLISGATAIPLRWEVDLLAKVFGADEQSNSAVDQWIFKVRATLNETDATHPFLFYGTDWLAFGHFVIAISFIGALRDPVRNVWLFDFGLIACVLVVPYALIFGAVRGIPFWWRLIDCSFGVVGFIPLWLCRKWTRELSAIQKSH